MAELPLTDIINYSLYILIIPIPIQLLRTIIFLNATQLLTYCNDMHATLNTAVLQAYAYASENYNYKDQLGRADACWAHIRLGTA